MPRGIRLPSILIRSGFTLGSQSSNFAIGKTGQRFPFLVTDLLRPAGPTDALLGQPLFYLRAGDGPVDFLIVADDLKERGPVELENRRLRSLRLDRLCNGQSHLWKNRLDPCSDR